MPGSRTQSKSAVKVKKPQPDMIFFVVGLFSQRIVWGIPLRGDLHEQQRRLFVTRSKPNIDMLVETFGIGQSCEGFGKSTKPNYGWLLSKEEALALYRFIHPYLTWQTTKDDCAEQMTKAGDSLSQPDQTQAQAQVSEKLRNHPGNPENRRKKQS